MRYDTTHQAKAAELVAEMVAATRAEDGNLEYRWGTDINDPGLIHVFEVWRDQAAIDAHMASPHMAALFGAAGDLGVTDVSFHSYPAEEPTKIM